MRFQLTILGCNAAIPANGRHPSAQVLNIQEQLFLIDCGEGTQIQMNLYQVRKSKINQIFISHLHGDHFYGLIGLLTSYSLAGRNNALQIFGPEGLEEIINVQLKHSKTSLQYDLEFIVVIPNQYQLIYENKTVEVYSLPLIHRIPCTGFLFKEKAFPLNIRPEKIKEYNIPFTAIPLIKKGKDFTTIDGLLIKNKELTFPPVMPRSYAYCSDTSYNEKLIPFIKYVDLLYHEATFRKGMELQANATGHSTAYQAAQIAKQAKVRQLILGHYSSRFLDLELLLQDAKSMFKQTVLAIEGQHYTLPYQKNAYLDLR